MKTKTPSDIDEYISTFPEAIREILKKIRKTIRKAAPDAEETICYGIPTFKQSENLVHFAAFSRHIGFFPTPSGVRKFRKELAGYKTSMGTIQFPLGEPIPYTLISRITKFRVAESLEREKVKRGKKSRPRLPHPAEPAPDLIRGRARNDNYCPPWGRAPGRSREKVGLRPTLRLH